LKIKSSSYAGERLELILIKRKAVSPVITTVILVTMGVIISFFVSYWMMGVTSQYTKFERVETQGVKCIWDAANDEWVVTLRLKNTGTHIATLTSVSLNEVEIDFYNATTAADGTAATNMTTAERITSGGTRTIQIYIDGPGGAGPWLTMSTRTNVNIKLHSTGGAFYLSIIELT